MEKERKYYTNEEKISLVRQYLQSGLSKYRFSKSIGITPAAFRKWLCKFGNPDLPKLNELMAESRIPSTVEELQQELIELRKEKKLLEKKLKNEELCSLAYRTLVELAESTYHIKIKKNSAAK